jgi:hypothetical protein
MPDITGSVIKLVGNYSRSELKDFPIPVYFNNFHKKNFKEYNALQFFHRTEYPRGGETHSLVGEGVGRPNSVEGTGFI